MQVSNQRFFIVAELASQAGRTRDPKEREEIGESVLAAVRQLRAYGIRSETAASYALLAASRTLDLHICRSLFLDLLQCKLQHLIWI